ncbi:MAG: hypothetical protein ABI467_09945 [Kofleriaceae bacterium]
MKLLIACATLSLMTGCLVEQHRNCARGERWDGHHCMVDRGYHDHDHDHDRDRDRDHDHDRDHRDGEGGVDVRDHR